MKNLMAFQATVVLGVAWSCAIANAQPPLVDQANETFVSTYFPLSPAGGVGQEFSPTLNSLGFVDVWIFNEAPVGPADFTVRIREGSIAGGILGASEMATIGSPPSLGPTRFAFAATVGLTGGATHVLEVVQVMGGAGWGAGYGPNSGYAAGQAIFGTSPVDYDLWFREGVLVPEPGVWVLGGLGTVLAGCILRRRSGSA